ncbi:MAG: hypothetical protein SGI99_06865 [Pseudomonadota bacterium]|nr:hypothetical protein [Pseudomonadota bacterium]
MFYHGILLGALGAVCATALVAATPDQPLRLATGQVQANEQWLVNGGEFKIRLNRELLQANGVGFSGFKPTPGQGPEDEEFAVFPLVPREGLQFNAPEGGFDRFTGGKLGISGGFSLKLPSGQKLTFKQAELRYSHENPMRLELVGDDGRAWFYLNHLMYKMVEDNSAFYVRSADLRASKALADKIGRAQLADEYVGEVKMLANVVQRPFGFKPLDAKAVLACPDFHGTGPQGDPFQADVLMESYSMSGTRCRLSTGSGSCDGPAGSDDGDVVFTPSSTLRNSNKASTADIPWYQKFTTSPFNYPYPGNDQHPYLIWNMYRIVDGQLEQIGASGVKHAFLTVNSGCAPGACTGGGHILGKNCGDTYGTGNNDSSSSLGPRTEMIPATGQWARCNSIYDDGLPVLATNLACDGQQDSSGNDSYMQRMVVKESKLPGPATPAAQYFSESWYIVQDDVNIYNTMAHRSMAPVGAAGAWTPGTQGSFVLGPVINAWVDPLANPTQNVELATPEGDSRIAVKAALAVCPPEVTAQSGVQCYRYDYVVNNFDYAHVKLMPPPNHAGLNLGIVSSSGFSRFSLNLGSSLVVVAGAAADFSDVDSNAANDWTFSAIGDTLTWTAPAGNDLKWGSLYRFSFITTTAPNPAFTRNAVLGVQDESASFQFSKRIMVPNVATLFEHDFE